MIKWIAAWIASLLVMGGVGYYFLADHNEPVKNSNDAKYVAAVHKIVFGSSAMDDSDIIASGKGLCESLDLVGPDITYYELVDVGMAFADGSGGLVSSNDSGAMMGNAITYYCPEYIDDVERAIQVSP